MALIQYQGGWFDQRTYDMYRELERITPFQFFLAQGGFNPGGVSESSGTHDRAAVDISGTWLTPEQRWELCTNGRKIGFAMWIRKPPTFSWHLHGVPINGDTSPSARAQVVQYLSVPHLNGLAGRGPDDGPTGYYDRTWEKYQGNSAYRPPINTSGGSAGTTNSKDWFDMATASDLNAVVINALRSGEYKDIIRTVVHDEVVSVLRAPEFNVGAKPTINEIHDDLVATLRAPEFDVGDLPAKVVAALTPAPTA